MGWPGWADGHHMVVLTPTPKKSSPARAFPFPNIVVKLPSNLPLIQAFCLFWLLWWLQNIWMSRQYLLFNTFSVYWIWFRFRVSFLGFFLLFSIFFSITTFFSFTNYLITSSAPQFLILNLWSDLLLGLMAHAHGLLHPFPLAKHACHRLEVDLHDQKACWRHNCQHKVESPGLWPMGNCKTEGLDNSEDV